MISRNVVEQLANSPEVACEVLADVSTEALIEMYGEALVDEPHPLDREGITAGLLVRQSSSLSLVLARFASFEYAYEHIIAVAEISRAHKCALLSNPRIPWYRLGNGDEIKEKLLAPVLLANDTSTQAFLRNPRAHRKLIALAVRGQGSFVGLPLDVRLNYAIEAANPQVPGSSPGRGANNQRARLVRATGSGNILRNVFSRTPHLVAVIQDDTRRRATDFRSARGARLC